MISRFKGGKGFLVQKNGSGFCGNPSDKVTSKYSIGNVGFAASCTIFLIKTIYLPHYICFDIYKIHLEHNAYWLKVVHSSNSAYLLHQ